jgi:hypothetical protein
MVVQQLIEKFVDYCSRDETRVQLESKLLGPITQYLAERFHWTLKAFQALTVLVAVQTFLLVWLLFRSYCRPVVVAAPSLAA